MPRPLLAQLRESSHRRRARKEARALLREARGGLRRFAYRLPEEVRDGIQAEARQLEQACASKDHDGVCAGLARLEVEVERHLSFARKSTLREYAESIGVAVLIALFLRAFVVEAFKIPSGSMIPTMEVGDHIFVNKFVYGLRVPFTKLKFFEMRKPHRGEVIVFIYPVNPDLDFIKRIVGVEGDTIEVRDNILFVNGVAVPHHRMPGPCEYVDYEESIERWIPGKPCARVEEELGGCHYTTILDPHQGARDFPGPDESGPYVVPKGTVFVMGDNRNNSHDSRFWGPVPLENIKGEALVVWWSAGGPDGVRWRRLGKLVD